MKIRVLVVLRGNISTFTFITTIELQLSTSQHECVIKRWIIHAERNFDSSETCPPDKEGRSPVARGDRCTTPDRRRS